MNLILWVLTGGLFGSMTALYFGSNTFLIIGDFVVGLTGALVGGLWSARNLLQTPVGDFDEHSFSPGGFFLAFLGSIFFLIIFNLIF